MACVLGIAPAAAPKAPASHAVATGFALPGDLAWSPDGRLYTTRPSGRRDRRGRLVRAGLYRFTITATARRYHRTARGTVRVIRAR